MSTAPDTKDRQASIDGYPTTWVAIGFFTAILVLSAICVCFLLKYGLLYSIFSMFVVILLVGMSCVAYGLMGELGIALLAAAIGTIAMLPLVFSILCSWDANFASNFNLFGWMPRADHMFWISVLEWAALAIGVFAGFETSSGAWEKALLISAAGTAVVSIFIEIGQLSAVPYAVEPIRNASEISKLLDARILLSCALLLFMISYSIAKTLRAGYPNVARFPRLRLPMPLSRSQSLAALFLTPFVLTINTILYLTCHILGAIWHVLAVVFIFIMRVCRELKAIVVQIVRHETTVAFFRIILTMCALIGAVYFSRYFLSSLLGYLQSLSWDQSITLLGSTAARSIPLIALFLAIGYIVEHSEFILHQFFEGLLLTLAAIALSALPLYLIANLYIFALVLPSFTGIGPFTVIIGFIVGVGLVVNLLTELVKRKQ